MGETIQRAGERGVEQTLGMPAAPPVAARMSSWSSKTNSRSSQSGSAITAYFAKASKVFRYR